MQMLKMLMQMPAVVQFGPTRQDRGARLCDCTRFDRRGMAFSEVLTDLPSSVGWISASDDAYAWRTSHLL